MKYTGLHADRLHKDAGNPREVAFARQWVKDNEGRRKGFHGRVAGTLIPDCTERDAAVAATVIQWLGSNVGMAFLQSVIKSSPEVRQWVTLDRPPVDIAPAVEEPWVLQRLALTASMGLTIPKDRLISGQLITTKHDDAPDGSNRDCLSVVGVVAAPRGYFGDLHQYTVAGQCHPQVSGTKVTGQQTIEVDGDGVDLSKRLRGMGAAAMLTAPIWRV